METPQQNPKKVDKAALVSISMELGFIIALPLVGFGLVGKWLDHRFNHTFPWITLVGIALAITATTVWLTQKLKTYMK